MTNRLRPSTYDKIKPIDIIIHFQKSEEIITLPGYFPGLKFIKKAQIKEVTEGFKHSSAYKVYIMPNGNVSYLAKDKESADYKVTRKYYVDKSDAKKKLSVINVEVSDPDLEHSNFEKYSLIHHYAVMSKGDPKEVPDVTKHCIRTVEPVEALIKAHLKACQGFNSGPVAIKHWMGPKGHPT